MKKIVTIVAGLIVSTSAIAQSSNEQTIYNSHVGAQVIARVILDKGFAKNEAKQVIKMALESGKAQLGEMVCDRAAGLDHCTFKVSLLKDSGLSVIKMDVLEIRAHIYQGKVTSAQLQPLPIE